MPEFEFTAAFVVNHPTASQAVVLTVTPQSPIASVPITETIEACQTTFTQASLKIVEEQSSTF